MTCVVENRHRVLRQIHRHAFKQKRTKNTHPSLDLIMKNSAGTKGDYPETGLVESASPIREFGFAPVIRTAKSSPAFVLQSLIDTEW